MFWATVCTVHTQARRYFRTLERTQIPIPKHGEELSSNVRNWKQQQMDALGKAKWIQHNLYLPDHHTNNISSNLRFHTNEMKCI
jgi:hypothetical protein